MRRNWQLNRGPGSEWWRPDGVLDIPDRSAVTAAVAPDPAASSVPFWALMGFSFVALIAPQELFPVLAPLRIALLTAVAAVVTYLWDRLVHRQPVTILTREIWLTAALAGWAILTLPLSYWPGGSVDFLLSFYFKSLAVFWLLANTVTTLTRLYQVAWGLSLMAAPLAVTGVGNFLSGHFMEGGGPQVKRIVGYEAGLTGNPNDLALMLNLILPLSVALLLVTRRPLVRALLLGLIGLDVVAVILTLSRGGFVTLATILAVYLWKTRRRPERGWAWAALLVVMLVSALLLPSRYVDRMSTITSVEADPTGSAQLRWDDTVAAAKFLLANPIVGAGVGMNVLALVQQRGDNRWTAVHNVYLEYAMELGLPGLLLFLLLLAGCFGSVRFVQRRSRDVPALRELFHLAEGIQLTLIAFTVAALFHPVAYHLYFYYMAGLAVAAKGMCAVEERNAAVPVGQPG